jgi:hypothetical protein
MFRDSSTDRTDTEIEGKDPCKFIRLAGENEIILKNSIETRRSAEHAEEKTISESKLNLHLAGEHF